MSKLEKFDGGIIEWESIIFDRIPSTNDSIPSPCHFHLKSYNYISHIQVAKNHQGKGKAKLAIEMLLRKTKRSTLIMLYNHQPYTGFVMERMLRRLGFRKCYERGWTYHYHYFFLRR